jgi:lantibiotic transport system ATP-binding protein
MLNNSTEKINELVVEIKKLNYSFKKDEPILKDLSIKVPQGSVYGFLGPNGAGKTTTLRLLLGLLKQQNGVITVFDKALNLHRSSILSDVGSLIEQPSLYLHLSGEENLEVYRQLFALPKSRIQEILKLVDLEKAAKKKAKGYSLGMKQRLSIGIALLHNPKLLILDEPTNGLDPNGIIDMRNLLGKLNKEEGTSIIISSHLLSEIEKIATHVGIIHKGEMMFEGSLLELQNLKSKQATVKLECDNIPDAMEILKSKNIEVILENKLVTFSFVSKEQNAEIISTLVQNKIQIFEFSIESIDLENIFLQITNN